MEELEINGCSSLKSINEIAGLTQLNKLELCDNKDIDSLKPIEKLNKLESVVFYGSTNIIDGDLSSLIKLNQISNISFQDRPHYSHKKLNFVAK